LKAASSNSRYSVNISAVIASGLFVLVTAAGNARFSIARSNPQLVPSHVATATICGIAANGSERGIGSKLALSRYSGV
jgi:hypothetical protein